MHCWFCGKYASHWISLWTSVLASHHTFRWLSWSIKRINTDRTVNGRYVTFRSANYALPEMIIITLAEDQLVAMIIITLLDDQNERTVVVVAAVTMQNLVTLWMRLKRCLALKGQGWVTKPLLYSRHTIVMRALSEFVWSLCKGCLVSRHKEAA